MKKTLFTVAALLGLLLVGCNNDTEQLAPRTDCGAKELKLTTALAGYTRATDTAFEQGDKVGFYMILPQEYVEVDVNVKKAHYDNYCFEVDESGALTAAETLWWYADESYTADLVAYYPYDAEKACDNAPEKEMTFMVKADQRTAEAYTASDFMVAHLQSAPTEEALSLPFKHLLSKVVVTVDNQLGEELSGLWFSGVLGTVSYNLETPQSVTATDLKGAIRAYHETTRAEETFRLILAPQSDVTPELIVTTVSEKQYTFTLEQAVSFASGKQYTAHITLDADAHSTEFTPTVTDWVEDEQFVFVPRESLWGVVGGFNGWDNDVMMSEVAEGVYMAEVTFDGVTEFKLRYDGDWDKNRGLTSGSEISMNTEYAVSNYGANLKIDYTGKLQIWYNAAREVIWVEAVE